MEVYKQLAEARKFIAETNVKKEGKNTFAKYEYYTPSQITSLVNKACYESNILTVFNLIEEDGKYIAKLTVHSVTDSSTIDFVIPTAMPDIKATNIAQKLGGMVTYSERYLKMIAFEISDNNLDLDNDKEAEPVKPKLDNERFNNALKAIEEKKTTVQKLVDTFNLDDTQLEQLKNK